MLITFAKKERSRKLTKQHAYGKCTVDIKNSLIPLQLALFPDAGF